VEAGADPNSISRSGYTPLQNAAQYSDRDSSILEILLIAGAEVNTQTPLGTALDRALGMGQVKTVRILLDAGADEDLLTDANVQLMPRLLKYGY